MALLGLIYVFASAKPISIRRLSLLFVATLMSATLVLRVLRVEHAPTDAMFVAASLTLFAWSAPLLQIAQCVGRSRKLSQEALDSASLSVKWTYGFVTIAIPALTIAILVNPVHNLTLAALERLIMVAGIIGLICAAAFRSDQKPRTQ